MNTTLSELIIDTLPHGSGIDYDWNVSLEIDKETAPDDIITVKFTANNSWHVMDSNGCYCGIVPFTATGQAHLTFSGKVMLELIDVSCNRKTIKAIVAEYTYYCTKCNKEYKRATKSGVCRCGSDLENNAPYLDDLGDYIYQTIDYCFSEYNKA